MRRRFNVIGSCIPQRHYMVSLDDRLKCIREDKKSEIKITPGIRASVY